MSDKQSKNHREATRQPDRAEQSGLVLRRRCDCGQHTPGGSQCRSCSEKKHELRRSALNREERGSGGSVPPIVHDVLRSNGQPLDGSTRNLMESRFGRDFSRVRLHTDERAAESARSVDALAYTVGQNVVFGANLYSPKTRAGLSLLSHELTHVAQSENESAGQGIRLGSPNSAEERVAEHNETAASPSAVGAASGGLQLHRKGGTAGGFFANIGRAIGAFFTGSERDYDKDTLTAYLKILKDTKEIEDDFDSDNKARAVVRKDMFQAESFDIWILLVLEMMSGAVLDDDEQAILKILRTATPEQRNQIAEKVGYERLYDKFDGKELDELYALLPLMNSFHPRGAEEYQTHSFNEFISKWEKEHGHSITEDEKQTLAAGCIGITMLNLGVMSNPDLSNCYGSFQQAWDASRKMNAFLAANQPDKKAIVFSKRFWSSGKDYKPDPKTGKVDMSGYKYETRPNIGDEYFTNFDYGFLDEKTGKWWHANHCDPVIAGPDCDVHGRMETYESNLQHYSRPLKDFDRQVFCVGISTIK